MNARIASAGPLADVGNVVNYLVDDPVEQTVEDFGQLGARLAEWDSDGPRAKCSHCSPDRSGP